MKYALIYTGQGAQRPGMGKDLYDTYESARRVFEESDDALGFSLSDIIFNGTPEDLMKAADYKMYMAKERGRNTVVS